MPITNPPPTPFPNIETQGVSSQYWPQIIPWYDNDLDLTMQADGAVATRTYLVPWDIRNIVARQFLGYPYSIFYPGGSNTVPVGAPLNFFGGGVPYYLMARHLPETIPYLTTQNPSYATPIPGQQGGTVLPPTGYLYADSLKMKPYGGGGYIEGVNPDDLSENIAIDAFPEESPLFTSQPLRTWEWALITVTYKTQTYDVFTFNQIVNGNLGNWPYNNGSGPPVEANRYVDWEDDDSVKFATVAKPLWVVYAATLDNNGNPTGNFSQQSVGDKLGLPYVQGQVTMTWFDVAPECFNPQPPIDEATFLNTAQATNGYEVNSQGFYPIGLPAGNGSNIPACPPLEGSYNRVQFFEFAPGTLIYLGYKRRRRVNAFGARVYNIEYSFLKKPSGVNAFISNSGRQLQVYLGNGKQGPPNMNVQPIKAGDFSLLFLPSPNQPSIYNTYLNNSGDLTDWFDQLGL